MWCAWPTPEAAGRSPSSSTSSCRRRSSRSTCSWPSPCRPSSRSSCWRVPTRPRSPGPWTSTSTGRCGLRSTRRCSTKSPAPAGKTATRTPRTPPTVARARAPMKTNRAPRGGRAAHRWAVARRRGPTVVADPRVAPRGAPRRRARPGAWPKPCRPLRLRCASPLSASPRAAHSARSCACAPRPLPAATARRPHGAGIRTAAGRASARRMAGANEAGALPALGAARPEKGSSGSASGGPPAVC
mmetsp:Transcript_30339/g.84620  ORF Transcript_30339/g.84620 Transcript_30339/m.84620 type:complete len:243 (+) Transcript_30339:693-1421(+)